METVYIQIRAPRGQDPGRVVEGHYNVVGDTVVLVDRAGKAIASDNQRYSRKCHHNAARGGSPRGFGDKITYPKGC